MIISLFGVSCGIPVLCLSGVKVFGDANNTNLSAYRNALQTSILPDMRMAMLISLAMIEPDIKQANSYTKSALALAKSSELKSEICRDFGIRVSNMQETSLAFKYFERAYKYNKPSPNQPSAFGWSAVGLKYMLAKRYDDAIQIYSDLDDNAAIARAYTMKKDYNKALAYINKALGSKANPDTYATRANIYLNMGNTSAAEADCRIALSNASQQRVDEIYKKCNDPQYFQSFYAKK